MKQRRIAEGTRLWGDNSCVSLGAPDGGQRGEENRQGQIAFRFVVEVLNVKH
jgi:hypothetical protein